MVLPSDYPITFYQILVLHNISYTFMFFQLVVRTVGSQLTATVSSTSIYQQIDNLNLCQIFCDDIKELYLFLTRL